MSYKRKPENIAFSITVTPDKKKILECEETSVAVLAPFNPFPKISFENVQLNFTATREVYLANPTENTLQIELTKLPDEARGYKWSATNIVLPKKSQVKLSISWTPSEFGSWHDNVKIVNKKTRKVLSELKLASSTEEPAKASKRNLRSRGVLTKKPYQSTKQEALIKKHEKKTDLENKENEVTTVIENKNVNSFEHIQFTTNKTFTQINVDDVDDIYDTKTSETLFQTSNAYNCQNSRRKQFKPSTPRRETYEIVEPATSSRRSTYSLRNRVISNVIESEKKEFDQWASPSVHNESLEKAASKLGGQHNVITKHPKFKETELTEVDSCSFVAKTFTIQPSVTFSCSEISSSDTVDFQLTLEKNIHECNRKERNSLESIVSSETFYDSLEEKESQSVEIATNKSQELGVKQYDLFVGWDELYDIDKFCSGSNKSLETRYSVSRANVNVSPQEGLLKCYLNKEDFPNSKKTFINEVPGSSNHFDDVIPQTVKHKDSLINLDEEFAKHNFSIVSSSPVSNQKILLPNDLNKSKSYSPARSTDLLGDSEFCAPCQKESVSAVNSNNEKNSEIPNVNINRLGEDKTKHWLKRILDTELKVSCVPPQNCSNEDIVYENATENVRTADSSTPSKLKKLSLSHSICLPLNSKILSETDVKNPNKNEIKSKEVFLVPPRINKRSSFQKIINPSPQKIKKYGQEIKIKRLSTPAKSKKLPYSSKTEEKKSHKPVDSKPILQSATSIKKRKSLKVAEWIPAVRRLKLASSSSQSEEDNTSAAIDFSTPDPYLAATTLNPFAKGGLYLNNKWLKEQEVELIQWADRMLRPPNELQLDRDQTEHSKLHRLNALRTTAFSILTSTEVATVLSKVKLAVDKNIISIRSDRQLHADLGLQDKIISLLMCYNPLWLRLCLEVVYQCNIELRCHSDQNGLRDFIRRYVLNDEFLRKKHSHPTIPYLMLPQFEDEIKKFTVYRFLVIVYLLDLVKVRKLIYHDPCLFKKDSKFKTSKEVLLEFNKEFVASGGDITRILRLRGYEVTHSQSYIDEFDFSLNNTAELRDGVRLTRLVENLVSDFSLCSKLRVPAVSILQKKFNVEVAFSALKKAGHDLPSDIIPKDISDGHNEKTLSFLWYLRSTLQKHAVLLIIAKWHETKQLRQDRKNFLKIKNSVIKIQKWYRKIKKSNTLSEEELKMGCKAREHFLELRAAAVSIQKKYREKKEEREKIKKFKSATIIQNWYKSQKQALKDKNYFIASKKAATTIQRAYRKYKSLKYGSTCEERKYFLEVKTFAIKMQRHLRLIRLGNHQRQQYLALKLAAIKIQRRYRANKQLRSCRNMFLAFKRSALIIQKRFRALVIAKHIRNNFINRKKAVIVIQKYFRAYLQAKELRQSFLKIKTAAISIQRMYRSYLDAKKQREHFLLLKATTITIQQRFRRKKEMIMCRNNFLAVKKATIVIQTRLKAFLLSKHQRKQFIKKKVAAIALQRRFRSKKLMNDQRCQFLAMKVAAVKIQRKFRAKILAKVQRESFISLKKAAVVLQRSFRSHLLLKSQSKEFTRMNSAAIMIQRKFRAKILAKQQRRSFVALKSAVVIVQRKFRYYKLANQQRQMYLKMKTSAVVIQRKYRAYKLAQEKKNEFIKLKMATILIQKKYRNIQIGNKERKKFLAIKSAAVTVQRIYRKNKETNILRNRFNQIRNAAVKIQRKFKAVLLAKHQRQHFLALKSVVIDVQGRFRRKKLAEHQRREFLKIKAATLTIERIFKSNQLAKQQRRDFLKKRNAAITIQRIYKSHKQANQARKQFMLLKTTTIFVQRKFRALLLAKQQRQSYLEMKNFVVKVQRRFRSRQKTKMLHENFICLKTAVIKIQRRFRELQLAKQQRLEFLSFKAASLSIERRYRSNKVAKREREHFTSMKLATVKIQRWFRSLLLVKKERQHYILVKMSTIKLQRMFRAKKEGKLKRESFLKMKTATIAIQRKYRSHLLVQADKKAFLKMKASSIKIQKRFRALKLAKRDRTYFIAIRKATLTIQTRFRAFLIAKELRQEFLELKSAVLTIQRRYKAIKKAKTQRKDFLALKNSAVWLQRKFRNFLIIKHYRQEFIRLKCAAITIQRFYREKCHRQNFVKLEEPATISQTRYKEKMQAKAVVEDVSILRKHDAALRIQAAWRGYLTRKTINVPQTMKLKPTGSDTPTVRIQTISTRGQQYFRFLSNHRKYSVAELQNTLFNIDKITVLSADQCDYFVKNGAVRILYNILKHQANKAFGVHTCVELILSILLNLYRAPITAECVWKETKEMDGIFLVFDLMMRFKAEKTSTVFCKACTVIWLFSQDPTKAEIIMKTQKVQETFNYVVKSMKKNEQSGPMCSKKSEQLSNKKSVLAARKKLPALRFNCGNYFDDHRAFDDKLFALNALKEKLGRYL